MYVLEWEECVKCQRSGSVKEKPLEKDHLDVVL